jgi:hypothetical protein
LSKHDILEAVRASKDEPYRLRGLFVPLSHIHPYVEDHEFIAAVTFALRDVISGDPEVSTGMVLATVRFCDTVRSTAFRPRAGILRPGWRDGVNSANTLGDQVDEYLALGHLYIGYSEYRFQLRLFSDIPVMRIPLTALEAAAAGIEARRCAECGKWMMHRRAQASFCRSSCSSRARSRKHREAHSPE